VPQGGVEHDTVQPTPMLAESLLTVAINGCVPLACTVADAGETATSIGGALGEVAHPELLMARATQIKICNTSIRLCDVMAQVSFRRQFFLRARPGELVAWGRQSWTATAAMICSNNSGERAHSFAQTGLPPGQRTARAISNESSNKAPSPRGASTEGTLARQDSTQKPQKQAIPQIC